MAEFEVIDILAKLSVENLNEEWIKFTIDADFTEVQDLPYTFEEYHETTNFVGLFNGIKGSLRSWVDTIPIDTIHQVDQERRTSFSFLSTTSISEDEHEKQDNYTKFWLKLTKSLNLKSLLCLLFFYIHKGQKYDAKEEDRDLGILASGVYFLLLAVPGSNAFRVFHPMLYLKALDILRLTTKLNIGASPKKSGRGSKAIQRKSDDIYGENDDEDADLAFLSSQEASKLTRSLNILLNDFLRFIQRFSLKHSPESLEETVIILVDVTRCEIHNAVDVFIGRHGPASTSALCYNAYVALQSICIVLHGSVKKTTTIIMKHILSNILMSSRGSSDLSARALNIIREHSVIFVKYLLIQIKEDTSDAVYILLQHLCLRGIDKADFREKTARAIVDILKVLSVELNVRFLHWLYKFSHNEKAGHRLFALEVISKLIVEDERSSENTSNRNSLINNNDGADFNETEPAPGVSDEGKEIDTAKSDENERSMKSVKSIPTDHSVQPAFECNVLSHKFLLSIIFSRCRDSAATVRSKALSLLASCTVSDNHSIVESMRKIFFKETPVVFTTPHIEGDINCESPRDIDNTNSIELTNAEKVLSLLRRRALDEKVTVRKSALQVLENLLKLNKELLSARHLDIFVEHCRDPALLIRKQVISSLTLIMEKHADSIEVIRKWVKGIMPLILDPEIKVQEKVIEVMDNWLFSHIYPLRSQSEDASQKLPWRILEVVTDLSFHKFFSKILMLWSKSEFRKPRIVVSVKTHIGHENNEQAWMFLALLTQYFPISEPVFALNYFEEHSNATREIGSYTLQKVLKVICHSIKHIPAERVLELKETLLHYVVQFSLCVELISSMIDAVVIITYSLEGEEEKGQKAIEQWASPILKSCDDHLQNVLFTKRQGTLDNEEEELLYRHIYTLGEVSMLCPTKVNNRLFLMMQSIIFQENHLSKDKLLRIPSTQTQNSQAPAASFIPTKKLKSVAVVSLGKMFLQHENQAKRIIPALGKLLETTSLSELKVNVIFVLSDMCVRYATLVDPLMPQVTACLMDPNVQVRRTTLTLLINLLQEDYLKLKGSFFYRILQCLCDEDNNVKDTVKFYLIERLLKRFPKIFLQHFIECIFHYNCYEEHESYNRFVQTTQEKELFSLAGPEFREKRTFLYCFMLEHMTDEQRFATTQRLCQDVLGGIVDGRIKLSPSSLPMVEDTLMVLSSEEIKLATLKTRPEDVDQACDEAEQAQMAGIAIKKTIISQVVKRNVIENIVPILIALKQRLQEQRSPLMKQLLLYIKELMKDYKNEIREILADDKKLIKEIEFDLRKLEEKQQTEEEERRNKKEEERRNQGEEEKRIADDERTTRNKAPSPKVGEEPIDKQNLSEINTASDKEGGQQSLSPDNSTGSNNADLSNFVPSPSFVRRKSDGAELRKKAIFNNRRLTAMHNTKEEVNRSLKNQMKECSVVLDKLKNVDKLSGSKLDSEQGVNKDKPALYPKDLLRAVSTPNKVLDNITFINRSQEISAINFADSIIQPNENNSSETILLHFKSPEAFAKDEEFSRLKHSAKKCLTKNFKEAEDEPTKRPLGGFMESFNSHHNEWSNESLNGSSALQTGNSINKSNTPKKKRKSKRNLVVASRSKTTKTHEITPLKELTPKRRK